MINSVYHIASGQITANIQESGTPTDESQVSVREGYSVYNGLLDSSNMWIDEGGNPQPRAQIDVTASPYCLLGDTIKLKSKTKGEIW